MDDVTSLELEGLKADLAALDVKVQTLTANVQSLLDLWNQGKGILTFMRWAVAIAGAVGAFFTFVKPYLK